jgi:antitoxin CptB
MRDEARSRLRWRCRRGMRELDLLLEGWLESRWRASDATLRDAFGRLLERPDPELASWLIGGVRPSDAALAALVDEIVSRRN